MSNDWSKLILGDDNSQTAPICNGQVRDLLDELATLKHQRDMLLEALKPFANEANKYDPDEGDSSQKIWDTTLMIGHLRKARVAIAAVEMEK